MDPSTASTFPRSEQPATDELPSPQRAERLASRPQAERRLDALAAAVRDHERTVSERPYSVRYADLSLYRRLRQIAGGA